jgi:hypothetical protein
VADRPAASVVVTNHDYGRFLAAAVDSALAQEGLPVEVIVVDDGSTDGSGAVLDAYEGRARVVRQANGGQGAAMNAGFALARGEVVAFLDADDLLDPDAMARCAAALAADPGAVRVQFPLRCVDAGGRPLGVTMPADPGRLPRGDVRAAVLSHPDDLAWQVTSGNAFLASALARVLPMPPAPYRISADHYLSNLTPLLGRVAVLDSPAGSYRIHGANADFRSALDLDRTRAIVTRTVATHEQVDRLAGELGLGGLGDPLAVRSVTFAANRLVSLRFDPGRHPVPGDRRWRLVADGTRAALARPDLGPARRAAAAGWFAAVAALPRAVARPLVGVGLAPPTGRLRT